MSFLTQLPVLGNAVDGLMKRARWKDAEGMLLRMLTQMEPVSGPDDPETQKAQLLLAHVCRQEGRVRHAETLDSAVFEARQLSLGLEAPETVSVMYHLAEDIKAQPGRLLEGLALERRALEIAIRLYWDHDREMMRDETGGMDVLVRMCNLADTLFVHDQAADAVRLHETVLRLCTSSLGPGHPYTIAVMDSTGRDYVSLGRLDEAIRLLQDAVEAGKVHLGDKDTTTQRCIVHLAETYGRLTAEGDGQVPEPQVVPIMEQAVAILQETIGIEESDTVSLKYYLAVAYARMDGRFAESEALQEQVLDWCRKQLGDRSGTARLMVRNLALMYRQLGRMDKARMVEHEFSWAQRSPS
jgi:tetratricopeptide (TPR) repeat protein